MPSYRRLNPLHHSGSRATYPQGPADPHLLSDLPVTPSPAHGRNFSGEGNFFALRSDDRFDGEHSPPPEWGNGKSSSTIDVGAHPSQGDGRRSSGHSGNQAITFVNAIPEDEFKNSGLVAASTIYEPDKSGERPKVAIRSGLRANLPTLLPHVIAVAATWGVISLSYHDVYWMDLVPPTRLVAPFLTQGGALNALQFAAKLHELLILASLTTIVMYAVRAHLLGQAGLPFGLVASGFQIFSGEWLRRKSFWAAWKARQSSGGYLNRYPFLPFLALFVISSVLATLAGPSSAIAIVPTLNYFPLAQPFNATIPPFYVFNKSTELWPAAVTAANLNGVDSGNNCTFAMNSNEEACPSGGFRNLYVWAENLLFLAPQKGTNISFQDDRGETRRMVSCKSCPGPGTGKASAMSLNAFLTGAMTTFWTYTGDNFGGKAFKAAQPKLSLSPGADIFAPRVHVVCDTFGFNRSNTSNLASASFPPLRNNTSPHAQKMSVPEWTWNYTRPLNSSNFTWVPLPENPAGPSIGSVFTVPFTERADYPGSPWYQASEIVACSVYAQWAPVDTWYEPVTNDHVEYSVADSNADSCLNSPLSPPSTRQAINITLGLGYANAINTPIDFATGPQSVFNGMMKTFITNSVQVPNLLNFQAPYTISTNASFASNDTMRSRSMILATLLATVTTDGLARIAGGGIYPYSTPIFVQETSPDNLTGIFPQTDQVGGFTEPLNTTVAGLKKWLQLDIKVDRYGYGYQWRGSKTVQFGITVLLIHVSMAAGHLLYVVWVILVRQQGISCSWDQITELIALAINSKSTNRMKNTSAGIKTWGTWREIVAVRETYDGHLEMVIGDEAEAVNNLAEADKKYG